MTDTIVATKSALPYRFSLDPENAELLADPYPTFALLRENDPMHWSELGFWVASRYDDVRSIVMNRTDFGQGDFIRNIELYYGEGFDVFAHPAYRWLSEVFVYQDPPRHTRLRGLVSQALTAKRVREMRPRIQAIADRLIDAVIDQGRMELIHDFAYRLPTLVMCDMLGIGEDEASDALLSELNQAIADSFLVLDMRALSADELALADRQIELLETFFDGIFQNREDAPRDDLATAIMQARDGGEGLSRREMVTVAIALFGAGFETTAHMLGNGILTLHRHPDQWQALVDDPALASGTGDEVLRYESSLTATYRTAFTDVTVRGRTILAGQRILLLLGAGNRDPEVFPDADRFDIDRRGERHLSFGGGIHFCVGAELARLEAEIGFATLARRLPDMTVEISQPQWRGLLFRGLSTLDVRWDKPGSMAQTLR